MKNVLVRTDTTYGRAWPYKRLHWLMFFICICLTCVGTAHAKEAQQSGDSCNTKNKLPSSLVCVEGFIVDCRKASDSRELLYCVSNDLQKADAELNRIYQGILKKLTKPNDEYADYKSAQRSLIQGQHAWLKFKKSDCEVPGYLNLKGSAQSNEIVSCELKHTKNRVADLSYYFAALK
jgi:uncharacterized protein YecT (DUF1311 family)